MIAAAISIFGVLAVLCILWAVCLSQMQRADREKRRADALQKELERVCRSGNRFPIGLDMTVSTN